MNRFQVIGINDKRDFCECCGKSGLKRVVWVLDTETGDEKHFGTSCASSPAKGFNIAAEIKAAVRNFDAAFKAAIYRAAAAYKKAGGTMTNGKDLNGSAIATRDDKALWESLLKIEVAR